METESDQMFMEELQRDFLDEASFLVEQCEEAYLNLDKPENRREELSKIFRLAHSLKGAGSSVGFADLSHFAHVIEDCLTILRVNPDLVDAHAISLLLRAGDAIKIRIQMLKEKSTDPWKVEELYNELKVLVGRLSGIPLNVEKASVAVEEVNTVVATMPDAKKVITDEQLHEENKKKSNLAAAIKTHTNSVKVDTDRIDSVLNMVGELVVIKSQLMNETLHGEKSNSKLNDLVSHLDKSIRDLQERALGMRMTPLKNLFLKTQRITRDLSLKLNKPIKFEMGGEDTEIDRNMIELLGDPFMHIVRNALDHGIEKLETRVASGKPASGTIKIIAQQSGGRIIVRISDDGGGISREKIIKKALEKGLISADKIPDKMPEQEVFQYIFAPGFSTADQISDVSGRGVGMDVVKTNIEQLKGTIDIKSEIGKGTTFIISVPLTTSITEGMQVICSGQQYILPLDRIRELIDNEEEITTQLTPDKLMLKVRENILPVVDLAQLSGHSYFASPEPTEANQSKRNNTVIVVESSQGLLALRLNAVIGQVQVVLKPMGDYFSTCPGIAGAAILGDGKVALVLDVDNLEQLGLKAA